jgi:SAM-dependent methyltransferase
MADTFGMALLDYFEYPDNIHILERDDGYLNPIKTSAYFNEFNNWAKAEQELSRHVKGRVLDVGCGSGRSVKHFQEQGLNVVGIDISEGAIEASKRFGAKNCVLMDAMNLEFPAGSFDTVILFGNGLGLCGLDSMKMLEGLHRVVKPGGLLFASSRDPRKTDSPIHLAYHARNRLQGKPIGLLKLRVNYGDVKGDWFDFYMSEPEEVEPFIHGSGWVLEHLTNLDESIYGIVLRNT